MPCPVHVPMPPAQGSDEVISAAARIDVEWIPLEDVRFDRQPIDRAQVDFYTRLLTGNGDHVGPPILNADRTVRDGRHRLLAHRAAGRTHARCLIVHTPEGDPS